MRRTPPLLSVAAMAAACVACVTVPLKERVGETLPAPLPDGPVVFDYESLDERSVSAPSLRGKPAVLAFVVSDTLAGQAQATILAEIAKRDPDAAAYAIVAVEPKERRELVQGFVRFFTDKTQAPLLGAMAGADALLGLGPFGDVRALTVVVLDGKGRVVLRRSGIVPSVDITRALAATPR